jgi:hypothetical protein
MADQCEYPSESAQNILNNHIAYASYLHDDTEYSAQIAHVDEIFMQIKIKQLWAKINTML